MDKLFLHQMYKNILDTGIVFLVVMLAYGIANIVIGVKTEGQRQRRCFRVRAFYLASIVFIFLLARIWVEGFTHLVAVLGLVSAALVITNKETIMNVVGWLVITWRDLFAEDDLIQIQQYKGYVKSIGLLYFTLSEVSSVNCRNITGKIVRIPNGLTSNNALINFSQISHITEKSFVLLLTKESDAAYAKHYFSEMIQQITNEHYQDKKEFSTAYIKKHHKLLTEQICLEPTITMEPKHEAPCGIKLTVSYYGFLNDIEVLQKKIWSKLLASLDKESKINLSYE